MSLESEIIVVSGLPRSGTSLMMQMLDRAGIPAMTDEIRAPDPDNPRGYYEFERVKQIRQDTSWLPAARGHAVKMVSSLLYDLPTRERYRVVFMQRDLDEVLASQEKMLRRLNRPAAPTDSMKASFTLHLERLFAWLADQPHLCVLVVSYNSLMADPEREAGRIHEFLDRVPPIERLLEAVDPNLYRNRLTVDLTQET